MPEITDYQIAAKYVKKADQARNLKIKFDLTLSEFTKILKRKRCAYSGLPFNNSKSERWFNLTIDRIDNKKGYVSGNVTAVCFGVNNFKALLENPENPFNETILLRTLNNMKKIRGGIQK